MSDAARSSSTTLPGSALGSSAAAGAVCLVVHGWTAWTVPAPPFSKYPAAVRLWADGVLDAERLVDFSPAYFRLTELVSTLAEDPRGLLVALQVVLVALAVAGLHWLFARQLSPTLAWIGSGLLILDRHLLVYERVLEPEILLLACLVAVAVLLDRTETTSRREWIADAAAGLLAGLAVATRPTFLPVFLAIPLFHALRSVRGRRLARRSLAFLVALLPGLLLVFGTAWRATGDPWTPVMNPGTVFFEGQQPLSRGTSAIYPPAVAAMNTDLRDQPDMPHVLYRRVARADDAAGTTSIAEVNAFWSARARHHLLADPGATLQRTATKARYAFHTFRWHDLPAAWRLDARLPLPAVPLAAISALAILGVLADLGRWRHSLMFYTLAAVPLAVMLAFYVSARQRLVWMPALVYFALVGVEALRGRRATGVRPRIAWVLVVALLPVFVWPDDAMRDTLEQRRTAAALDRNLGPLRADQAPLAQRADELLDAFTASPGWLDGLQPAWIPTNDATFEEALAERLYAGESDSPSHHLDVATLRVRVGRLDDAERLLVPLVDEGFRAYRGSRTISDPRILLARVRALRGDSASADALLGQVLHDVPGEPFALAERLAILPPDAPTATAALDTLGAGWAPADIDWLVAKALRLHGRAAEALPRFERLCRAFPDWRGAHVERALALAALDRPDAAVDALVEANRLGPEPIVEPRRVRQLVATWAERHASDAEAQELAARLLHQHGAFDAARARIATARALDPPPEALRRLDALDHRIRTLGDPGPI